jgi:hypothetical protein
MVHSLNLGWSFLWTRNVNVDQRKLRMAALVEQAIEESIKEFERNFNGQWKAVAEDKQTGGVAKISWNLTAFMNSPWRQPSMIHAGTTST